MTIKLSALAGALLLLSFGAAAADAPAYVAGFASPVGQPKLVSSGRLWTCGGLSCVADGAADSPPRHICSRLARELGVVTSFAVRGEAFDADALAACNAKAKRPAA